MSVEGIKEMIRRQPFQPFVIWMVSGREDKVERPGLIAASPSYRRIYVAFNNEARLEMPDMPLIESVQAAANTLPNG